MRKVFKKSRHIEWNMEESPDNFELVRYHFIVVDDKRRESIMNEILQDLSRWGGSISLIRNVEGKVVGSNFRYLFRTYDSNQKPDMINFIRLGKSVKRNYELYERKKGNIEDYVSNHLEKD